VGVVCVGIYMNDTTPKTKNLTPYPAVLELHHGGVFFFRHGVAHPSHTSRWSVDLRGAGVCPCLLMADARGFVSPLFPLQLSIHPLPPGFFSPPFEVGFASQSFTQTNSFLLLPFFFCVGIFFVFFLNRGGGCVFLALLPINRISSSPLVGFGGAAGQF